MHRYYTAAAAAGPGSCAIRDFLSNTEKWGIFLRQRKKRRSLSPSLSPLSPPSDPKLGQQRVFMGWERVREWSIFEMLSSCLASGKWEMKIGGGRMAAGC